MGPEFNVGKCVVSLHQNEVDFVVFYFQQDPFPLPAQYRGFQTSEESEAFSNGNSPTFSHYGLPIERSTGLGVCRDD